MSLGRVFTLPALGLLFPLVSFSQTGSAVGSSAPPVQPPAAQAPQPPSYANYSIMLVNPAGGAVVLMHDPKGALEFVDVAKTKEAFASGYIPARAAEIGELISALKGENARLAQENSTLKKAQASKDDAKQESNTFLVEQPIPPAPAPLSEAQIEAQRRAQLTSEAGARRERLIETWMVMQNMNRPQPYQLPQPYRPLPVANPTANRLRTNCTTQVIGNTGYTDCQ